MRWAEGSFDELWPVAKVPGEEQRETAVEEEQGKQVDLNDGGVFLRDADGVSLPDAGAVSSLVDGDAPPNKP